jgi:uncharacterized YigZ family protein
MTCRLVAPLRFEPDPTKGSRFIATAIPVETAEAAKAALAEVQAEMPDATHHCWAWRLAPGDRLQSSDAGEPGGSAGRPILAQITGHDVVDVLVVVTRYYGGTKLGVGGLVRAYGGAAGKVLDRAETVRHIERVMVTIEHAYEDAVPVDGVLRRYDVDTQDTAYGERVSRHVRVPSDAWVEVRAALLDATAGRVQARMEDAQEVPA